MIPSVNTILTTELTVVQTPSKQYRMDFDKLRIRDACDNLEAVRQAVFKILNTERYDFIIYSWDYGIELKDLYGQPHMYVCPEITRRVKEALLQDDRITDVTDFEFDTSEQGVIAVSFTVHTIFGDLEEELAVNI